MPDDPFVRQLIVRTSRKYGLDPGATLAVARGEGGLRWGAVGDGGHAFGPFQMNDAGGVLTNRFGSAEARAKYANSAAGVDEALRAMSQHARGLRGPAAISAIVSKYERPKDIPGSIARATSRYQPLAADAGTMGAPSAIPRNYNPRARAKTRPSPQPAMNTFAASVLQANNELIGVPSPDFSAIAAATPPPLRPPVSRKTGELPGVAATTPGKPVAKKILAAAHQQIGKPYVWGGESRSEGGFDCSGLIYAAYLAQGIKIPRTTYEQVKIGRNVKWGQFRPGDLIFTNGGGHVVLYAGGGKVIAAPRRGETVQYQPLEAFRKSFYTARRYL